MSFLFKLRLLNGPLAGRELALPAGELTLGQGDVDLQLPLEGMPSNQVVILQINEQGVFLNSDIACWLEGKPWKAGNQPLPLQQVIDIAGQGLLLGAADSTLIQQPLPARQDPTQHATGVVSQTIPTEKPLFLWRKRFRFWGWTIASLLIGSVTLFAGGGWLLHATSISQNTLTPEELTPWIRQQLQQPGLAGMQFAWQPDGTVRFTGDCQDSKPLNALMIQLRRYGVLLREPVICQDQLLNNVRYVLYLFGYEQFTVSGSEQPGEVSIRGAIQSDDRWRQVVDMLSAMPGLKKWEVENHSDRQLKGLLRQLRKAGLLGKLSLSRSGERLVISGRLSPVQQKQLNQQLVLFNQHWQPAPMVIYQNIPASEESQDLFPAAIVSVGGSEQNPFLEMANGVRLQVGARLPNGYQISAIDGIHGVELTRDGQLVHVPLEL